MAAPIDIIEKILLLTDNPCKYNRVSNVWYRTTKKITFWRKFFIAHFNIDLGMMYNYEKAWKDCGGDKFDPYKCHLAGTMEGYTLPTDIFTQTDSNEINDICSDFFYNYKPFIRFTKTYKGLRRNFTIDKLRQKFSLNCGWIRIILHGPKYKDSDYFGQLSIPRNERTEHLFQLITLIEDSIEVNLAYVSRTGNKYFKRLRFVRRIKDAERKWLNIRVTSHQLRFLRTVGVANGTNNGSPFQLTDFGNSRIKVPSSLIWSCNAYVRLQLGGMWFANGMCGLAIYNLDAVVLQPELPPCIQQIVPQNMAKYCPCGDCRAQKDWDNYLDRYGDQLYDNIVKKHDNLVDLGPPPINFNYVPSQPTILEKVDFDNTDWSLEEE